MIGDVERHWAEGYDLVAASSRQRPGGGQDPITSIATLNPTDNQKEPGKLYRTKKGGVFYCTSYKKSKDSITFQYAINQSSLQGGCQKWGAVSGSCSLRLIYAIT